MRSPQAALESARAGLAMAWDSVHFLAHAGAYALREVLALRQAPLHTATLRGRGDIVAIDIASEAVWRRIAEIVGNGNASLMAPLRRPVRKRADAEAWLADAGADLLTEAPTVATWLRGLPGPLDVAALGYLDGERHVRLSLAMDMVQSAVCDADPRTTLDWMATPTDEFAVPKATARRAMAAYEERSVGQRALEMPVRLASGDRPFHPNVERIERSGHGLARGLVDSIVVEQGPN